MQSSHIGGISVMQTYGSHHFPGKLFIVEGVDGSGKSTQIALLRQWLISEGYTVFFSEWNSSPLVKKATSRGKKKQLLTPTTFSLIHATDFADRTEHDIIPPLKAGAIVLADRYIYTAFARDVARGVDRQWVRELYQFAVQPTLAFYYRVPLQVSLSRILTGRAELKYYEAGMDLGLSNDPQESFRLFQQRIVDEYEGMIDECGLTVMDATLPIPDQQRQMRALVRPYLRGVRRLHDPIQPSNGLDLARILESVENQLRIGGQGEPRSGGQAGADGGWGEEPNGGNKEVGTD